METKIHQIYGLFEDGIPIEDIPAYHRNVRETKLFCEKHNIPYQMWDNEMCNELITKYPEYKELYDTFRFKIQKADFMRYLVLFDQGGIYVDCDISPIKDISELFKLEQFFVKWNDCKKQLPYNAVLGSKSNNKLYRDIMDHVFYSVEDKNRNDIYKKWVGRYVFQTTGHFALQRVLKKYPNVKRLDILYIKSKGREVIGENPLFHDENVSMWYQRGKVV